MKQYFCRPGKALRGTVLKGWEESYPPADVQAPSLGDLWCRRLCDGVMECAGCVPRSHGDDAVWRGPQLS